MKKNNLLSLLYISSSTLLVGILSYLYHPIMIRYLDIKEYAEFASLIGIINLLSVVSGAISLFLVKEISKSNDTYYEVAFIQVSKKLGLYLGGAIFTLYLLVSPFIALFLNIDNTWIILFTGTTLFLSFLGIYQTAFFQGKKFFRTIAIFNIFNPVLRLAFGVIFILFGIKVFGAIGGFIVSQIVLLIAGYAIISREIKCVNGDSKKDSTEIQKNILNHFKKEKKQIFQFLFTSLILALLMNIDILFAKHFFDDEVAGIYAGISIIAKFLVFVGMSIETVYYPILTSSKHLEKNKVYILSLLYILGTLGALGFFALFGEQILHLLKPGFEKHIDLLYLILIYCGMLALLNFLMKILIAFGNYLINILILATIIVTIPFLYIFVNKSPFILIEMFNLMMFVSITISLFFIGIGKSSQS